jgi:hypothetical protein
MILLTHYFCDFNCVLLLFNHILLRDVFFCQKLTFIRLTLKAIYVLCSFIMIMPDNVIGIEIAL